MLRSLNAAALLPGNEGLYSLNNSGSNHTFEIIDTAASRWTRGTSLSTFSNVFNGYQCDVMCAYPTYFYNKARAMEWGFDPQSPAKLPFPEGELAQLVPMS